MEELPLLSVIVPVYRVEHYLNTCVRSILRQTYENLEIFLVDDGSPDGSGALCDDWARQDSRIRVLHRPNGGSGAARNAALELARGALIGFVDSDDYIAPDMYRYLYSLLDDQTDIAECGFLSIADDGAVFGTASPAARRYTPQEAMDCHIRDTAFRQVIWNKLYRRRVLEGVRFPEGTAIDDEFFTYRAIGRARGLIRSERVCYAYRQQSGSIMHRPYSLKRLDGVRAKEQRLDYLRAHMPALEQAARQDLRLSCLYAMQGSLRALSGEELKTARTLLRSAAAKTAPLSMETGLPARKKALLLAAGLSLEGTARALNVLEDLHILS